MVGERVGVGALAVEFLLGGAEGGAVVCGGGEGGAVVVALLALVGGAGHFWVMVVVEVRG